jgi:ArsR family transcriptional regulator
MEKPTLDEINLLHAHVCQALSEPRRLQILYALREKPQRVNTLAEQLDIPQPTVSRHLAVLRQRSLVSAERNGTAVAYTLADSRIIEVLDLMRQVMREALERQSSVLA